MVERSASPGASSTRKLPLTWVLVADGGHAKVLQWIKRRPSLLNDQTLAIDLPASHNLVSDRPGRSFESQGRARHAIVGRSDPHRRLKREFAKQIAHMLAKELAAKRYERLVVVAPPTTLVDLRNAYSKTLREKVIGEFAHDLVKLPTSRLSQRLAQLLPGAFERSARRKEDN
jgi:protein required for attachment to host cells